MLLLALTFKRTIFKKSEFLEDNVHFLKSIFKVIRATIGIIPAIIILVVLAALIFFFWIRREKEVKNLMDKYDIGSQEEKEFSVSKAVKEKINEIENN